jgi:hypothetical protein
MSRMRRAVAFVMLLVFANFAFAAQVEVVTLKGTVTAQTGTQPERPLKQGDALTDKTRIKTGPGSSAVLRFDDGQVIALKSLSRFSIDAYEYEASNPGAGKMLMSLVAGGLRAITGLVGNTNKSNFALKTPLATIGIRGTHFLVSILQGDYVRVLEGSISMTTDKGTGLFTAGQTGFAAGTNLLPSVIPGGAAPTGVFDELLLLQLPGGAANGAAAPVGGMSATQVGIGVGLVIGIGAAAAASSGGSSTTTHH